MHDAAAPFVWTIAGRRRRRVVPRHRQRRQGDQGRSQAARARCSTTAPKWKCTRSPRRRTADCTSAPRPTAASTSVDAKGQATPFFDPDDKYIWSLAVDRDGNVFAGTGDKGTVYKITPDGKGAEVLRIEDRRMPCRSRSIRTASCWSAPARRAACSASTAPARASCCSTPPTRKIHAIRVDPKGVIYAAAQSGRARRAAATSLTEAPSAPPPVTPSIPNVSTEITSITVVDVGGVAVRRLAHSSADRRSTMTGAVYPRAARRAVGRAVGADATMRRTTSPSSPTARSSWPPARRASCSA